MFENCNTNQILLRNIKHCVDCNNSHCFVYTYLVGDKGFTRMWVVIMRHDYVMVYKVRSTVFK
jgi:hypothetical protein